MKYKYCLIVNLAFFLLGESEKKQPWENLKNIHTGYYTKFFQYKVGVLYMCSYSSE